MKAEKHWSDLWKRKSSFILHTKHWEWAHSGGFLPFCRAVLPAVPAMGKHSLHPFFPKLWAFLLSESKLLRHQGCNLGNSSGIQTSQICPWLCFLWVSSERRTWIHPDSWVTLSRKVTHQHRRTSPLTQPQKRGGSFGSTSALPLGVNGMSKASRWAWRQNQSSLVLSYCYNQLDRKTLPWRPSPPNQPSTPALLLWIPQQVPN